MNCPTCGAVIGLGASKCPQCGGYASKTYAAAGLLQNIGCLIMLVVFAIVPLCISLYACATS